MKKSKNQNESRIRIHHSLPLLLVAVLVEAGVLAACYLYETTMVPAGLFTILGLSGLGIVLCGIETLKLPLAYWLAGRKGLLRKTVYTLVLLTPLCLITWEVVKDMGTNEILVSLEPAIDLEARADGLEREQASALERLDQKKANRDKIELERQNAAARLESELTLLREERDRRSDLHQRELEELIGSFSLSPAEQEERARLIENRTEIEGRFERAQAELHEVDRMQREQQDADRRTAENAYKIAFEEWERQRSLIAEENQVNRDRAAADYDSRLARYESDKREYDADRAKLESERSEIIRRRDAQIAEHEANNKPFYGLESKVKAVRESAAAELERVELQLDDLRVPQHPGEHLRVVDREIPPMPQRATTPQRVSRDVADELARLRNSRDSELQALDAQLATIAEQSKARLEARQAELDHKLEARRIAYEQELANLDARIAELQDAARQEESQLAEAMMGLGALHRDREATAEAVKSAKAEASRLRAEAAEIRRGTQVYRVAAVLRWFMPPDTSEDRLVEMVQSTFVPAIAFVAAFLPAFLLEIAAGSWTSNRHRSIWTRLRIEKRARAFRVAREDRRVEKTVARLTSEKDSAIAEAEARMAGIIADSKAELAQVESLAADVERLRMQDVRAATEKAEAAQAELERFRQQQKANAELLDAQHSRELSLAAQTRAEEQADEARRRLDIEKAAANAVANARASVCQAEVDRDRAIMEADVNRKAEELRANEAIRKVRRRAEEKAMARFRDRMQHLETENALLRRSMGDLNDQAEADRRAIGKLRDENRELGRVNEGMVRDLTNMSSRIVEVEASLVSDGGPVSTRVSNRARHAPRRPIAG